MNTRKVSLSTFRMTVRSMMPAFRTPTPSIINSAMGRTTRKAARKLSGMIPLLPFAGYKFKELLA